MKIYFVVFILFLSVKLLAQPTLYAIKDSARTFELVSIDCNHDSVSVITPEFPSVYSHLTLFYYTSLFSSSYNFTGKKYYLCTGQIMYIVDLLTGAITDTFNFRIIHPNFFLHTVYNPKDGMIYGIYWNLGTLAEKFARFDPSTGIFTDTIPMTENVGVWDDCKSVIDAEKQEYIIQSKKLAAIDLASGNIIYNNPIQNLPDQTLDHIAYSCKDQKIFGLSSDPDIPEEYFSAVDSVTALVSNIDVNPLPVYFYKQELSGSSIDNNSDIYYYAASGGIIYGIDVHTGNVVYSHNYGPGFDFLFLQSVSDYYCMIESLKDFNAENSVNIFPNPAQNVIHIAIHDNEIINSVSVYNALTQREQFISHFSIKNEEEIAINVSSLSPGIYFLEIMNDKERIVKKFVKELGNKY